MRSQLLTCLCICIICTCARTMISRKEDMTTTHTTTTTTTDNNNNNNNENNDCERVWRGRVKQSRPADIVPRSAGDASPVLEPTSRRAVWCSMVQGTRWTRLNEWQHIKSKLTNVNILTSVTNVFERNKRGAAVIRQDARTCFRVILGQARYRWDHRYYIYYVIYIYIYIYVCVLYIYIYIYIYIYMCMCMIYIYIYIYICMCMIYIYIYIYMTSLHLGGLWTCHGQSPYWDSGIQGVLLKHHLNFKGWNSHVHREFSGKSESSNLSRDNVSREIGRSSQCPVQSVSNSPVRIKGSMILSFQLLKGHPKSMRYSLCIIWGLETLSLTFWILSTWGLLCCLWPRQAQKRWTVQFGCNFVSSPPCPKVTPQNRTV